MVKALQCVNCEKRFIGRYCNAKYCGDRCGNAVRSRTWRANGKEKELRETAKGKYHIHKTNALQRGIEFKLTFDEWWSVWEPFWVIDQHGKFCMCRTNDEGPYEIGNVRIDTWGNNIREAKGCPLK